MAGPGLSLTADRTVLEISAEVLEEGEEEHKATLDDHEADAREESRQLQRSLLSFRAVLTWGLLRCTLRVLQGLVSLALLWKPLECTESTSSDKIKS